MSGTDRYAEAVSQVLELVVVFNDDLSRGLDDAGLTVSRAALLWELEQRGPCTQRVLAEALDVTPRTVTGLVDGLAETGFVTREAHPTDRRATHVTLTEQGRRTTAAFAEGRARLGEQLFGGMAEDRFAHFCAAVAEVVDRLRAATREAGA